MRQYNAPFPRPADLVVIIKVRAPPLNLPISKARVDKNGPQDDASTRLVRWFAPCKETGYPLPR